MRTISLFLVLAYASPILAGEPKVQRGIPYAEPKNELQMLDVYAPTKGKNLPVVVWIHGGGWQRGDKADVQNKPKAFVDKGFVFVSINYRFIPQVSMQEMSGDVAKCSIYASLDSRVNGRMVVVLINKTRHPLAGQVLLHNADDFTRAQVYQLTSHNHDPQPAGSIEIDAAHMLNYTMPPLSVSTLLVTQEAP